MTQTELRLWHDLLSCARRRGQPLQLRGCEIPRQPNWALGLAPAVFVLILVLQWIF